MLVQMQTSIRALRVHVLQITTSWSSSLVAAASPWSRTSAIFHFQLFAITLPAIHYDLWPNFTAFPSKSRSANRNIFLYSQACLALLTLTHQRTWKGVLASETFSFSSVWDKRSNRQEKKKWKSQCTASGLSSLQKDLGVRWLEPRSQHNHSEHSRSTSPEPPGLPA